MYPHTSHQKNQPILSMKNVSLRYDGHLALGHVSCNLMAGEKVAVVGPNGAGKSTLLKIIAGVLRPTDGEVAVYGSGPSGHICIGYIPQRSQVDWRFPVNVADVVMMGRIARLGLFGIPRPRDWDLVRSALETVGIGDLYARQIGELSGGQQQRMFIARALAQEAELMLMDEPLTGLDAPSQEGLLSLISSLKERGVTVMMATHDLEQARHYFDRIMLLNHRLVAFDAPGKVLVTANLRQAYGERLQNGNAFSGLVLLDDSCCGDDAHD